MTGTAGTCLCDDSPSKAPMDVSGPGGALLPALGSCPASEGVGGLPDIEGHLLTPACLTSGQTHTAGLQLRPARSLMAVPLQPRLVLAEILRHLAQPT